MKHSAPVRLRINHLPDSLANALQISLFIILIMTLALNVALLYRSLGTRFCSTLQESDLFTTSDLRRSRLSQKEIPKFQKESGKK